MHANFTRLIHFANAAALLVLGTATALAQGEPKQLEAATVVTVSSGDTIVVSDGTKRYKVTLEAVSAPVSGQPSFAEARQALSKAVLGREVRIDALRRSGDGPEMIGRVYLAGRSINKQMIDEGWAWYARGEQHFPILEEAQASAREARLGLWQADDAIAPWDWREQQTKAAAERREEAAERRQAALERRRELAQQRRGGGTADAEMPAVTPGMPQVGDPFRIEGTTVDGRLFDWSQYAGKVVLVDFWATWCGPCVRELPNVMANYQRYHEQGFEVVGVSLDEDHRKLTQFLVENGIPWENLFSADRNATGWKHPMAQFYDVKAIPTVILVGRDGKVVSVKARGEELGRQLAALLDAPDDAAPGDKPALLASDDEAN